MPVACLRVLVAGRPAHALALLDREPGEPQLGRRTPLHAAVEGAPEAIVRPGRRAGGRLPADVLHAPVPAPTTSGGWRRRARNASASIRFCSPSPITTRSRGDCSCSIACRTSVAGSALGEELSIRFEGYLFHLGVSGLPEQGWSRCTPRFSRRRRNGRLDAVFEQLDALGCLVVLNHPLLAWSGDEAEPVPVFDLLKRYGWAIHALEFNGMRSFPENQRVIAAGRAGPQAAGRWRRQSPVAGEQCADGVTGVDLRRLRGGGEVGGEPVVVKRRVPPIASLAADAAGAELHRAVRRMASYRGEPVAIMLAGRGSSWIPSAWPHGEC